MKQFKPYPYQQYCIGKIIDLPALALWLDMGLGKTIITLTAILQLKYYRFAVSRVLVIAPKKVAESTWQTEAGSWEHLSLLRCSTVLGSETKRIKALNTPADIYITSRDNVAWLVDYYQHDWPFDMIVLDESSSFKNWQAKRWKKLKSIRPHIRRIVELTGTPTSQGLIDLWAQVYLLDQGQRLGRSVGTFREQYFTPDKRNAQQIFSYKPRDGSDTVLLSLLSDICISMRAGDYLLLPDKITDDVPVVLDAAAAKSYKQLEKEMLLHVDEKDITATSAAVLSGKLRQLCNGAVYGDQTEQAKTWVEIHRCKIDALLELLEQIGREPVLLFYSFQHDVERLLPVLQKTGYRVRLYQGPQDLTDWNVGGQIDVLMAHPASCAYGLNLQHGGHHIIWFGQEWSLELVEQANARLYRQGQDKPVIIHRLIIQGGIDEDVVQAVAGKGDVKNRLMDCLKARIKASKSC